MALKFAKDCAEWFKRFEDVGSHTSWPWFLDRLYLYPYLYLYRRLPLYLHWFRSHWKFEGDVSRLSSYVLISLNIACHLN